MNSKDKMIREVDAVLASTVACAMFRSGPDARASVCDELVSVAQNYGVEAIVQRAVWHKLVGTVDWVLEDCESAALVRAVAPYALRARHEQNLQSQVLELALDSLQKIPTLLLKGAALRPLIYPMVGHRSMGDIDLWVAPGAVDAACRALRSAGFIQAGPDDEHKHHAAPLAYRGVTVEVHRRFLGGGCADRWETVAPRAVRLDRPGEVFRPCTADLIWQAWHHTFRSAIHWQSWQLVGVSDIVRLLQLPDVDWSRVSNWTGLTRLRQIYPWPHKFLHNFRNILPELSGVDYRPIQVDGDRRAVWQWYWPSAWWLAMRHGILGESLAECWDRHLEDLAAQRRYHDCEPAAIYSDVV